MQNSVNAQNPSDLQCSATDYRCQLRLALDRITDLQKQLETVPALIEAIKQERIAAENERLAAARERESMDRSLKLADKALSAKDTVITTYETKLVPAYDKLVTKQSDRIDKLEDKVDKANKRTVLGIIGALAVGIASKF